MKELKVLWRLIILGVILCQIGICGEPYEIGFNDGIVQCKDFENTHFVGDSMELGKSSENGEDTMYLVGFIEFFKAIAAGTLIDIEIAKETELGSEPIFSSSMDLCKSLDDEDAPWAAAIQSMNITGCPIATGKYYCNEFFLNMDFMKDKLTHEWEGSYGVIMKLKNDKTDVIACHMMGLAIVAVDER